MPLQALSAEVDLVGADRGPVAGRLSFAGSVKWRNSPFDGRDLAALRRLAPQVPGYQDGAGGLAVVTRSGVDPSLELTGVGLVWRPDGILAAWQPA